MNDSARSAARYRMRRLCGYAATLVAAIAAIATSGAPERLTIRLPDSTITLTPDGLAPPEYFQVESASGNFGLKISLTTVDAVSPSIELRALDIINAAGEISPTQSDMNDPTHAELSSTVRIPCHSADPCITRFEVLVTTTPTSTSNAKGTLSIEASLDEVFHDDAYLAIERLTSVF